MTLPIDVEAGDLSHLSHHNTLHARYNNGVDILSGTLASRPAATAVTAGTLYWSTDTDTFSRSNGTTWADISAGASAHGDLTGVTANQHHNEDHAARHATAGADPITPAAIGAATSAQGVTNGDTHDHAGGDGAQIDHGGLAGLTDDDHTQYTRVDGTRAFTGAVSMGSNKITNVTDPTAAQDAATKNYVDTNAGSPWTSLGRTTLGSASATITVNSLSFSGYTRLRYQFYIPSTSTSTALYLKLEDSGSLVTGNYQYNYIFNGTVVGNFSSTGLPVSSNNSFSGAARGWGYGELEDTLYEFLMEGTGTFSTFSRRSARYWGAYVGGTITSLTGLQLFANAGTLGVGSWLEVLAQ